MPAASAINALIVDDQLTMRSLIRSTLQQIGVQNIRDAVDGEDALVKLSERPSNLIISDFNMPKLDGLALLRAVRANEATQKAAFIMLTGRADKDLVQRAAQFGANNYLVKPFTLMSLREKIEQVFGVLT